VGHERAQEPGNVAGQVGAGCYGCCRVGCIVADVRQVVVLVAPPAIHSHGAVPACPACRVEVSLRLHRAPQKAAYLIILRHFVHCRVEVSLERAFEPGMAYVALRQVGGSSSCSCSRPRDGVEGC